MSQHAEHTTGGDPTLGAAVQRALRAYAHALRLSCLAAGRPARDPERAALADRAVAAHVAARALAEEAVRTAVSA